MPAPPPKRYKVQRILLIVALSLVTLAVASLFIYFLALAKLGPVNNSTATADSRTRTSRLVRFAGHSHSNISTGTSSKNFEILDTNTNRKEMVDQEETEPDDSDSGYEDDEEKFTPKAGALKKETQKPQTASTMPAAKTETDREKWLSALRVLFEKWGYKKEEIPKPIGSSSSTKIKTPPPADFALILQGLVSRVPPDMAKYIEGILKENGVKIGSQEMEAESDDSDEESDAEQEKTTSKPKKQEPQTIPPIIASLSQAQTAEQILEADKLKLDEVVAKLPKEGVAGFDNGTMQLLNKMIAEVEEIAGKSVHEIKTRPCQEHQSESSLRGSSAKEDMIAGKLADPRQGDKSSVFGQAIHPRPQGAKEDKEKLGNILKLGDVPTKVNLEANLTKKTSPDSGELRQISKFKEVDDKLRPVATAPAVSSAESDELKKLIKEIGEFGRNEAKKLTQQEQDYKQHEILQIVSDLKGLHKGQLDQDYAQQLAKVLSALQKASNFEMERLSTKEGGDSWTKDVLHALNTDSNPKPGNLASETQENLDRKTQLVQNALNGHPNLPSNRMQPAASAPISRPRQRHPRIPRKKKLRRKQVVRMPDHLYKAQDVDAEKLRSVQQNSQLVEKAFERRRV